MTSQAIRRRDPRRARRRDPRRARRVAAARVVQVWGVCTVLVSGFASVVLGIGAVQALWERLTGDPRWGVMALLVLAVVGFAGWLLVAGWLAFRGLRQLVAHVAGEPLPMWPSSGGGGGYAGGGGDGGGGGGDGGGC